VNALRPVWQQPEPGARREGGRTLDEARRQRLYKLYDETNSDGNKKYTIKEI